MNNLFSVPKKLVVCFFALQVGISGPLIAQKTEANSAEQGEVVYSEKENKLVHQPKFEFTVKRDVSMLLGGTALMVGGQLLINRIQPLSEQQVMSLNRSQVNAFDRGATYQNVSRDGVMSDYLLGFSIVSPFTILASKSVREEFLPVIVMYLETGALAGGLTNISKGLFQRTRPYAYNPDIPMEEKLKSGARYSFFSGHSSTSAAFLFLTASMVQRYADKPGWKWAAWSGAVAIPGTIAYLRYTAGKHYPSDVLVGYAIGAGCGLLIPALHHGELPKDISYNIQPTPYGLMFTATF